MSRRSLLPVLTVLFFTFCITSACDPISDADDVELPVIEPKLVLNAYLIPQRDTQQLFVATSLPLNHDLSDYYKSVSHFSDSWRLSHKGVLPDATVHFTDCDNSKTITPVFDAAQLAYTFNSSDMKIREGGQYEVEVLYHDYPSIKERFVVPVAVKPQVECEDDGVATLIRIHAEKEPARYFCVCIRFGEKGAERGMNLLQANSYFVSTATSTNGAITIRHRTRTFFNDFPGESALKLRSIRLFELDERSYLYFTALEKNVIVQSNPFATPSLLRNYVKNGFGIAAGVVDHGEMLP